MGKEQYKKKPCPRAPQKPKKGQAATADKNGVHRKNEGAMIRARGKKLLRRMQGGLYGGQGGDGTKGV